MAKFRITSDIESTGYYYMEADTEEDARKRWSLGFEDPVYRDQERETLWDIKEV